MMKVCYLNGLPICHNIGRMLKGGYHTQYMQRERPRQIRQEAPLHLVNGEIGSYRTTTMKSQ